jgi:hypothetical protein
MDKFIEINESIVEQLEDANDNYPKNMGDLSDVGNEIGIVIAKYFDDEDTGFDKESFISGLNHGISLTDGTHG